MRERPRVSVVVPCFNQGAYLDDAVWSCVEAYEGPLEIVVVDDGSTDAATRAYLDELTVPSRCTLVILRQENRGLSGARNAGLARATGEYVQFLDADDLLIRNKLDLQLAHLRLNPALDVSISDYLLCDGTRTEFTVPPSSIRPFTLSLDDFLYRWERGFSIPIHTALFRRAALGPEAPFGERHRAKEDWVFWVRLALRGVRLGYLPLRLCAYRIHGGNMTRSWLEMGVEWTKATTTIQGLLGIAHPEFAARSAAWFTEWYARRIGEGVAGAAGGAPATVAAPAAPQAAPGAAPVQRPRCEATNVEDTVRAAAGSISVVIPVFNHLPHLRECIRSAHEQTAPPAEIVCVDDASTDAAVRPLLQELAAEIPELRLVLLDANVGIAGAQNLAVETACGEFVAFLDCDDFLHPRALEVVAREMLRDPGADYFFTDRFDIDGDGRPLRVAVYGGYPERFELDGLSHRENLLQAMIASHLKVMRRSSVLAAGGFEARTSGVQDWDLALKIAETGEFHYVPEPLYYHRIHAGSVTLGRRARMFRLTNEVRRFHQARRAGKPASSLPPDAVLADLAAVEWSRRRDGEHVTGFRWDTASGTWRHEETGTAVVRSPRRYAEAYRLWASTRATVFVLDSGALATTLSYLREFNSYYDLIVCADETQWATLHRYTWDARAIRLLDELPLLLAPGRPREGVAHARAG